MEATFGWLQSIDLIHSLWCCCQHDFSNLHHCLSVTCISSCCSHPLILPRTPGACGKYFIQQLGGVGRRNGYVRRLDPITQARPTKSRYSIFFHSFLNFSPQKQRSVRDKRPTPSSHHYYHKSSVRSAITSCQQRKSSIF